MHDDRDAPQEPPDKLTMRIRPMSDDRFLLVLAGELDHHNADRIVDGVRSALGAGATTVLLDLSHVSFLDSTGITRLLLADRAVRAAGGRLALIAPSEPVRRLLSLTGVDQVLASHPNRAAPLRPGAEPGFAGHRTPEPPHTGTVPARFLLERPGKTTARQYRPNAQIHP
ncbi:STAS domain-containing protein [Streptomyces radiopugnans]|uniref:STAS domain-containing protein n=1 Tax=Streptomyces radiopugnans TaxID=403935 RepID=UPI003F1A7499